MIQKNRKRLPVLLILLLSLGLAPAVQSEELSAPQLIIRDTSEKLQTAMKENPPAGNYERASVIVREIIEPHVDFNRVSALVLGKHWKTASTDQKKRFKMEFRELLIRTYAVAFSEYSDWQINYLPVKLAPGDKKVFVKTEIVRPAAPPVSVNYRMVRKKDDKWKVYDVVIEGISFITNYRTTFKNEVTRTGSLDSVIEKLHTRNQNQT